MLGKERTLVMYICIWLANLIAKIWGEVKFYATTRYSQILTLLQILLVMCVANWSWHLSNFYSFTWYRRTRPRLGECPISIYESCEASIRGILHARKHTINTDLALKHVHFKNLQICFSTELLSNYYLQTKKHADVIIPRGADNTGNYIHFIINSAWVK